MLRHLFQNCVLHLVGTLTYPRMSDYGYESEVPSAPDNGAKKFYKFGH
jgi:hypothetical protein